MSNYLIQRSNNTLHPSAKYTVIKKRAWAADRNINIIYEYEFLFLVLTMIT